MSGDLYMDYEEHGGLQRSRKKRKQRKQLTVEQFSDSLNAYWNERIAERIGSAPLQERDYSIPALGLMGEAGEAGEFFKKFIRDDKPVHRNRKLALELGDVLHYLCRLINLAGYTLDEVTTLNEQKLARRRKRKLKGRKYNG